MALVLHAQLTWLLDDPGVPAHWRALEGHSVNTYSMVNSEGKEKWVKFIWTPKGGEDVLSDCGPELFCLCICQAKHYHCLVQALKCGTVLCLMFAFLYALEHNTVP